jgi:uncharacterized lipoprotein NlpE involved in copper resistance
MKKFIVFLSFIVPFTLMACSNEKTESKKEVIVAPATATTPEKTTVAVDKNGVKVSTKKADVSINPEKKK